MCLVFLCGVGWMLKELKEKLNLTRTENDAISYKSTTSYILDLFALGASSRMMDKGELAELISKALAEDFNLALRVIFYLADIREGLGERDFFKLALLVISKFYPEVTEKLFPLIPEYGRWDYLYIFVDTPFADKMFAYLRQEHEKCMKNKQTSLMYKWLKSINASNPETKRLGKLTAKAFNLSEKEYRKLLSQKRKELKIVERYMSHNEWDQIPYEHVPSKASVLYRRAFLQHDYARYKAYLEALKNNEVKINTDTLYPHDIITRYLNNFLDYDETLELAWKNLPDYTEGKQENVLSVIDVSGSMFQPVAPRANTLAIDVAIGLGLYFAERINGSFKNHFLTYSEEPELVKIKGKSLAQKIQNITRANWGLNTNIAKVFDVILETAVRKKLPQKELPHKLLIISDMQFDQVEGGNAPYTTFKLKYETHGYNLPQVIFWQVNARSAQVPVTFLENGTALISGYSPITLKYILGNEIPNPYDLMLSVVMTPRYDYIIEQINH